MEESAQGIGKTLTAGRWLGVIVAGLLASTTLVARAEAAAFIDNGTVQLGVQNLGQLNVDNGPPASDGFTTTVGLRYMPTNGEALGRGAYEGWGLADATSGVRGYTGGVHPAFTKGVQLVSFTSTATSATSVVDVVGVGPTPIPTFRITHEYKPSALTPYLYEAKVTIKNISNATAAPRYRRTMDWDVPPNPHDEYVTIAGSPFPALLFSSDAGYAIADPLNGPENYGYTGFFTDGGPQDHGALFDFGFPALDPADTMTFFVYYGAAGTEAAADNAVQAVGAQTWSYGQSNPMTGAPNTYVFAYKGGMTAPPTCNGLAATIVGTSGADTLPGTSGADVIVGLGGDDTISGANGSDTICGGTGNDKISGGIGVDYLGGGAGDDRLAGDNQNDTLAGDAGNDRLVGDNGDDALGGGAGNDWLIGDGGVDTITGGAGNDWLLGGGQNDTLTGDAGNDWLVGDAGVDTLFAVDGDMDDLDCGGGIDTTSVDPLDVEDSSCP